MKKGITLIIFFNISIFVYADNEFNMKENILYEKGYVKFDPKEDFYLRIYENCWAEIFQKDWIFEKTGVNILHLDIDDGFIYNLYYPLEKKESPNILVFVYLQNGDKLYGYYKKNLSLDGILISTTQGEIFINISFNVKIFDIMEVKDGLPLVNLGTKDNLTCIDKNTINKFLEYYRQ